ncbi:Tumor protein D54 [Merluccius polli]|uniref:Tumor protein D54 n=1 Tax=Merluccius polli TaxID=89951 RepID=A0AA47MFK3_MERPO|nr:Tumor protein D54 [Merluccius polli]
MNRQGFGGTTSMHISPETPRHGAVSPALTEEDLAELSAELTRVEDEIQTLRQVLLAKEKYAVDIRRQLGTTPLNNIKHNLARGWQDVQTSAPYMTASTTLADISHSNAYKRTQESLSYAGQVTQESLSYAGQVTTAALSTVGMTITRRLADMRPSSTFKSFEEMVGSVKEKVAGGRGHGGNTSGFEKPSSRRGSRDGPF